MKKVIVISALLLSLHGYSEVQKQGDTETFLSPEALENADKDFQAELLKKDLLKLTEKKALLTKDSLERYDGLHKTVKPNPLLDIRGAQENWMSRDSAGRTLAENKYAYRPKRKGNS